GAPGSVTLVATPGYGCPRVRCTRSGGGRPARPGPAGRAARARRSSCARSSGAARAAAGRPGRPAAPRPRSNPDRDPAGAAARAPPRAPRPPRPGPPARATCGWPRRPGLAPARSFLEALRQLGEPELVAEVLLHQLARIHEALARDVVDVAEHVVRLHLG